MKLLVKDINLERLMDSEALDFTSELNRQTGEICEKQTASYHHCNIIIYPSGIVIFSGSIHKMWNSLNNYKNKEYPKGFNGNQFSLLDVHKINKHICELFDCTPEQLVFQNFEFGVNCEIKFCPQKFITGLLFHRNKPFYFERNEHCSQVRHERYRIKVYNKGTQYKMGKAIIRVELSFHKMEDLKRKNVYTFQDIDTESIKMLTELLLKRFEEIVYYDWTIREAEVSDNLKHYIPSLSSPNYWLKKILPNRRYRPKKYLARIIRNHSDNLKAKLEKEILHTCILNNKKNKTRCVTINQEKNSKCVMSNQDKVNPCVIFNYSSMGLTITHFNS